jgi:hypothetical protein
MHLRDVVRDDDVNLAIRVMLDSFISSQKVPKTHNSNPPPPLTPSHTHTCSLACTLTD